MPRPARQLDRGGGVVGARADELLVAEEAARRRGAACDRRGREAVGAELRDVRLYLGRGRAADGLAEEGGQQVEIAAVRLDGSRRPPRCEQREERLDVTIWGGPGHRHGGGAC